MSAPATPSFIAAYRISPDGSATALTEPATDGAEGYIWLHFDRLDPALAPWLEAHLPPIAAHSLVQTETRPRADPHEDGLIVNLRAVNLNPGAERADMVSIRLWITPKLIVSVRHRKVFAVDEIRQAAEAGRAPENTGRFLATLAEGLTERIESESLDCDEAVLDFEEAVVSEDNSDDRAPTSLLRDLIRLRRFLGPQREALARLGGLDSPVLGSGTKSRLRECANRTARAVEELDAAKERLRVVQDHLDAIQAGRIARNGYVLSIVAAIFLPLGFLTGLFGMNVAGLPGTQWPFAFLVLSLLMGGVGVGLFLLFRALKWF